LNIQIPNIELKAHLNLQNTMATGKKAAVVTGATGQLGRQVVKAFEKEGWEVFGTGMCYGVEWA